MGHRLRNNIRNTLTASIARPTRPEGRHVSQSRRRVCLPPRLEALAGLVGPPLHMERPGYVHTVAVWGKEGCARPTPAEGNSRRSRGAAGEVEAPRSIQASNSTRGFEIRSKPTIPTPQSSTQDGC